jgi:hypothetical protein
LIQTTFEEAPRYETLSYVWGTSKRNNKVVLEDGKILCVTRPLKEALALVAQQCATGYLWIDQICIDQEDRDERGDQVKIMGQIYSSCSRVLVWLGRVVNLDTDLSLQHNIEQSRLSKKESKASGMKQILHRLKKLTVSRGASIVSLCQEILQFTWFERAWVFQEIVLPQSALFILVYGPTFQEQTHTMSLYQLHAMISGDFVGKDNHRATIDTIGIMYRRCIEQHNEHIKSHTPIEQTLSLLAPRAKTSDPLDRLYAFFGLNSDPSIGLSPSYDCTLEVAMVHTAAAIIEGTKSLDIFEVIPRAVERSLNHVTIPTWTPDFREEHLVLPLRPSKANFRQLAKLYPDLWPVLISTQTTYYRGTIYCAGEEKRTIQAHGFVLDCIESNLGTLSSRTPLEPQLDALLKRCIKVWKKLNEHKNSSSSRERHDRTGIAAFTADLGFAPIASMERLRKALNAEGSCIDTSSDDSQSTADQSSTMTEVIFGRTLWMTRTGRLVLGSYLCRGDHVCLAYGCSNPIVLRGDRETQRVLGTCFFEGWMDPWSTGEIGRAEKEFERALFHIV